jgi:hypothetical protein
MSAPISEIHIRECGKIHWKTLVKSVKLKLKVNAINEREVKCPGFCNS